MLGSEENATVLPVISWNTGSTPMMASGGQGLQLRIWSPTLETERKEEHVLNDTNFTRVCHFFINDRLYLF